MENLTLNSGSLRCEFSRETGALVKLSSPAVNWDILDREELGLSFRLMVPLSEELRDNNVLGQKQKLSSYEERGDSIIFRWDGVTCERGEPIGMRNLPISLELKVAAEENQIVYYMKIDNRSDFVVEAVYCPYLGDVRPPAGAKTLRKFNYGYGTAFQSDIWPHFQNNHGYFGVENPTQLTDRVPSAPYYLIQSEGKGLYAGVKADSSELVLWGIELLPGYESSINAMRAMDRTLAGKAEHTPFMAVHMPYMQPGETREMTPIALEAYKGDWHDGVDIYKNWRSSWMKPAVPPEWARQPHSWMQLHINSPEDELRMRFTELPKVAEECKKNGVAAIQLVGWNDGGQDQGNPSHNFDPRLGTFEELKEAIAKCHEIGVKIILFSKFVWADRGTEWFRKELINYACNDPYGDYYLHDGYQYFTPAQLADINTKRLIPMCFNSEAYMKICEAEFKKLVDLGAAGMLFDECLGHRAVVCFNTDHGHRVAASTYTQDREFIRRLRRVEGTPKDFLMAGEAPYDWQMEEYQVSYFRSENEAHVPLSRYMLPEGQFMTAVTGFNDRNMIDQCLMFRYIISYEPYNFKGRLSDYPETVEYGRKMDALRAEYRKWFWDGEFRDTRGAKVAKEDGGEHSAYSVFRAADGSLGAVVVNYDDEKPAKVSIEAEGQKFSKYRLVDGDALEDINGLIEIPARSAVIVM
ncbi:MAG: DUF6259 domain-containing protein [Defluviitaleaceae bacterium]|nr:DUF6259 domain-containing protein [Defluviitaleaceae bacterium]